MRLDEWIRMDWDRWYSVCKAHGKRFTPAEELAVFEEVRNLYIREGEAYLAVLYVLMTNYDWQECAPPRAERASESH